jgi:hypothetical protein
MTIITNSRSVERRASVIMIFASSGYIKLDNGSNRPEEYFEVDSFGFCNFRMIFTGIKKNV